MEVLCLALFITINAKAVDSESKASFVIPRRMRSDIGLCCTYVRPSDFSGNLWMECHDVLLGCRQL